MKLIIDSRERDDELNAMIEERCHLNNIPFEYGTLACGDFVWVDSNGFHIGIERKTVSDFVNSLGSGHLITQMYDLMQFPVGLLFIEGDWKSVYTYKKTARRALFTRAQKDGALLSISVRNKIPVFEFSNREHMVDAIFKAVEHYTKHEALDVLERHTHTASRDPNVAMYNSVRGLGKTRIARLYERYPKFNDFMTAYVGGEDFTKRDLPKQCRDFLDEVI